jgi:hypothetical protein
MTDKRIPANEHREGLHPHHFYRKVEGPRFFGYAPAQLDNLIELGVIPQPVAPNENGRARGWFGAVILEWQRTRRPAPKAPAHNTKEKQAKRKSRNEAAQRKVATP